MMKKTRTFSEALKYDNFADRLDYLYIGDSIGVETFGSMRYINQRLYLSRIWRDIRDQIIIRDSGCDLGIEGCELGRKNIIIHHINPITIDDIIYMRPCVTDPDNLICTSYETHRLIHFGGKPAEPYIERTPYDTCPWKRR